MYIKKRIPGKRKKNLKKRTVMRSKPVRRLKMRIPVAPKQHQYYALRYNETVAFSVSSATPLSTYIYRINDLYDPNYSGTGHQPFLRDQMFTLYGKARVVAAKISVVFSSTVAAPVSVLIAPAPTGAADIDYATAQERKGSRYKLLPGNATRAVSCYSGADYYFGRRKGTVLVDDASVQMSTASLATDQAMWYQILVRNDTTVTNYVVGYVRITMYVRYEAPLQQTGS